MRGHADEDLVLAGRVRKVDRVGSDRADEAADSGRRRVEPEVTDAGRNLSGVCRCWSGAASCFMALSRAAVNGDDSSGTAPDPLVWSAGAMPDWAKKKKRKKKCRRCTINHALLLGPGFIGVSGWVGVLPDVCCWRCSVGALAECVAFLCTLHWPADGADLGVGVPNIEMFISCERWAGEKLILEKAVSCCQRRGRPVSVSAVPCGPGIDIWRSCRFLGYLMGALCGLPQDIWSIFPCGIGANHCR